MNTHGMDLALDRMHVHLEEELRWRHTGDNKRSERGVQRQSHEAAEGGGKKLMKEGMKGVWRRWLAWKTSSVFHISESDSEDKGEEERPHRTGEKLAIVMDGATWGGAKDTVASGGGE
jgi:hypothetical protein